MIPYRYNIRMFVSISAVLAIITFAASTHFLQQYGANYIVTPSAISAVLAGFWWAFDKYLWRLRFVRALKISELPDLNGTWIGTIDRAGENNPHKITYEITQTYTTLAIRSQTRSSESNTILAAFKTNEAGTQYVIMNYWLCRTKARDGSGAMEEFKGLSRISIWDEDGKMVLKDYYFTNRNPSTEGTAKLTKRLICEEQDGD